MAPPPSPGGPPDTRTPCWQCGTAVDALRHPSCPTCGATLGVVPVGPPVSSPPIAPPPFVGPVPAPAAGPRREGLVSGSLLTVIVAIVIVLVLAVLGILAGQAIGR
jgi:hypothetical protein